MSEKFKKKLLYFYGLFGFFGFTGFRYFLSHDIIDLYGFSFFAFWGYFFIGAIYTNQTDERYDANCKSAKVFSFNLAIIEMSILLPLFILIPELKPYILLLFFYCFSSVVLTYSIKFYILEKK